MQLAGPENAGLGYTDWNPELQRGKLRLILLLRGVCD
jgi:hypothetical protein